MVFVVTPCGPLSTWGCGLLNEKFSCINDNSGVRVFLKDFGNCRLTSSRVDQQSKVASKSLSSKQTHVVTILQTEASETPNMSPVAVCKVPRDTLLSQKDVSVFQAFFRHVILLFVPVFNVFFLCRVASPKQDLVSLYKI